MEKAKFYINGGALYEGYTEGKLWNGWECPYFTKEVADQMATEINKEMPDCFLVYSKATDSYIYKAYGDDELDTFRGTDINGLHLYPIGNASWIWDKSESEVE